VFARPGEDIPLASVIRSDHEHGQLAVVDEHVVLLGSGKTAITVVGREFAGRLLAELQAEWIGEPRECSRCGETMDVWRGGTADVQWQCPNCRIRIPEQRDSSLRTPAPERS
jgi:tRNA(Ile2) C34 agmatinyltransferase TiaS